MTHISHNEVASFFERQLKEWPLAAKNFNALREVETRELSVDGMPFKVQFNPARAVSSGAKVDAASIKLRPCFLCEANRPPEQDNIEWTASSGTEYLILVNPFPIFPRHLTIPDSRHTDQNILWRISDMIELARQLSGYTVFYNGPRCGASAPDHMHFQAGNTDFLTLPTAIAVADKAILATEGDSMLFAVNSLPVKLFLIEATSPDTGARLFNRLYAAMPVAEGDNEPMMNLLCWADGDVVRVAIIPRRRHRPSFYGTDGDNCMMISPASVDLGGVFITPRKVDFDRLDAKTIRHILNELCITSDQLSQIASNVR